MSMWTMGLDSVERNISKVLIIPDKTMSDMLNAASDVVIQGTRETAESMLHGPYYKGHIKNSMRKGKMRRSKKKGARMYVNFSGVIYDKKHPHGERVARIAYINEYGKKSQPARPFIKEAMLYSSQPATDAASRVLDGYLKQNNL